MGTEYYLQSNKEKKRFRIGKYPPIGLFTDDGVPKLEILPVMRDMKNIRKYFPNSLTDELYQLELINDIFTDYPDVFLVSEMVLDICEDDGFEYSEYEGGMT